MVVVFVMRENYTLNEWATTVNVNTRFVSFVVNLISLQNLQSLLRLQRLQRST